MPQTKDKSRTTAATLHAGRIAAVLPFKPLDKSSYVPMYAQIQLQLRALILNGRLKPGDTLPSEEELSRVYGVSRMTARQALQALKSQGLADRHKGLGTFVAQPKVEKDITHLSGFTAEMKALGLKPSSRLLHAATIPADEKAIASLGLKPGAQVYQMRRLRLADGLPVAIEESTLPIDRFADIASLDFSKTSLYATLRQRYGIQLEMVDEILEARPAGRLEAQLLELPLRSCLLVITRVLWSVGGQSVEWARSWYRGDRYRAVLRIPTHTTGL